MGLPDFVWRGPEVVAKMRKATRLGINRTMAAGVTLAKANHPWTNRTGTAERSIRVVLPAQTAPSGKTMGMWGSMGVAYFLGLEFGTAPHTIYPKSSRFLRFRGRDGDWVFARKVRHPGTKARPVLNPTARKVYQLLPGYIRSAWESVTR